MNDFTAKFIGVRKVLEHSNVENLPLKYEFLYGSVLPDYEPCLVPDQFSKAQRYFGKNQRIRPIEKALAVRAALTRVLKFCNIEKMKRALRMNKAMISKFSFDFLEKLANNNNRDWFNSNKNIYLEAHANIISFADALLQEMSTHDTLETASGKASLFRIYRDVRFSKDKSPYHTWWSGGFKRATKRRRGSYYFHIQPGHSFIIAGFWGPEPHDMKRIRENIDLNHENWKKLLSSKTIKNNFGKLRGEQLLTAPKGYPKDHPAIELLRYKQFLLRYDFTDKEVTSAGFARKVSETFRKMRPFLDHMTEVLTTDANGISLVDEE